MKELITRIIVAAVGIPLAILVIHTGSYLFLGIISVISTLALWEFYNMAHKNNLHPRRYEGIIAGLIILISFFVPAFFNSFYWLYALLMVLVLELMITEMFTKKPNSMGNIGATIMGLVYVSLPFASILGIRQFNEIQSILVQTSNPFSSVSASIIPQLMSSTACGWLVLSVFMSVWICDSSAYFVGKSFGKHKLFPRISPKKSWEGAIGGFFGAILGFYLSAYFLIPHFPIFYAVICGIIVGTLGQTGDLAESLLKRESGVKDSSSLIPGHGGILDRFDSILFAMPSVLVFLVLCVLFSL